MPETTVARARTDFSPVETPVPDQDARPSHRALDGYSVEAQVGFLLRRAHQRQTAIWQACMAEGIGERELTPRQFTALVKVVLHGRVTQNQLGRMAAMDPATIQGVVRRLIARGLVARALDPLDRRTAVLSPTPAGIALAARGVAHARRATERTLDPLGADERATLLALLARIA